MRRFLLGTSTPPGREHASTSSWTNTVHSGPLLTLMEATKADEAGDSATALRLYEAGVQALLTTIKREPDEVVQQQMRQKASRSLERAEELKRRISPTKPGGAMSSPAVARVPHVAPSRAPSVVSNRGSAHGGGGAAGSRNPAPLPPRAGIPVNGIARGSASGDVGGARGGGRASVPPPLRWTQGWRRPS